MDSLGEESQAYLPTGGLVCSFRGDSLTDSDLCRLLASECSWKERLLFAVALPAPYFDEKLSDWRGLRANMMQSRYKELADAPTSGRCKSR